MNIIEWMRSYHFSIGQAAKALDIPVKLCEAYLSGELKVPHTITQKISTFSYRQENAKKPLTIDALVCELNRRPEVFAWKHPKRDGAFSEGETAWTKVHYYIHTSDIMGFITVDRLTQRHYTANPMSPYTKNKKERIAQMLLVDLIKSDDEIDESKKKFLEAEGIIYVFGGTWTSLLNRINKEIMEYN